MTLEVETILEAIADGTLRGWPAPLGAPSTPADGLAMLGAATVYDPATAATTRTKLQNQLTASGQTTIDTWSQFPVVNDTFASVIAGHKQVQAYLPNQVIALEIAFGYVGDGTLSDLANGGNDSFLIARAREVAAYGVPTYIRYNWEMNGNWYDWAYYNSSGQTKPGFAPSDYIDAYRRVRSIFARYAPNASFVWCPFLWGKSSGSVLAPDLWYPGDAYVDWIGTNYYPAAAPFNYARDGDNGVGGLNYFASFAIAHAKPMAISEFGVSLDGKGSVPSLDEFYQFRDWMIANPVVKKVQYFALDDGNKHYQLEQYSNWATQYSYNFAQNTKYIQTGPLPIGKGAPGKDGGLSTPVKYSDLDSSVQKLLTPNVQQITKLATDSVQNTTTLKAETELIKPVEANSVYLVSLQVLYTAAATGDIKLAFNLPTGARFVGVATGVGTTAAAAAVVQGAVMTRTIVRTNNSAAWGAFGGLSTSSVATETDVQIVGRLITGANSGNFGISFAQNTSDATATTINPDSELILTKVTV